MKVALLMIVGIAILIGGAFYWYELRPSRIREECSKHLMGIGSTSGRGNNLYIACLKSNGLKE